MIKSDLELNPDDKYPKPLHPGLFSTINIDNVAEKLASLKKL